MSEKCTACDGRGSIPIMDSNEGRSAVTCNKCNGSGEKTRLMDTYSIRIDGSEVGRVSGEGLSCGKRLTGPELMGGELVDDPKLIRMKREGKTIAVFYVSASDNVTVEKVEVSA